MSLTRRTFLGQTSFALAAASAIPEFLKAAEPAETSCASPRRAGPVLVAIQLAGGNDGLNTIVPWSDPQYAKLRPTVSLPEAELLKLDPKLAFHSALASLRGRFDRGEVAVVQGVGTPHSDRSHFVSTAIWQSGQSPADRLGTGWLGRAAEVVGGPVPPDQAPFLALGVGGGGLTPALSAPHRPVTSLLSLDAFAFRLDPVYPGDAPALKSAAAALYGGPSAEKVPDVGTARFIRQVGRSAIGSSETLRSAVAGYSSKVTYPGGVFGDQLRLAAQILVAGLDVRIVHVTLGGFDTHANQKPQQRNLLRQLADGITALLDDLEAHGTGDRVTVMTYSEFGRRAQENASSGTDHGAGSILFLIGKKVAGGLHGPAPDLAALESGDVPPKVDFREVYASALRDGLEIPPDRVLRGSFRPLPLFRV
ncbi:MAG: DUF1501 domain-containing protein [Thermoanaerobaculia bacterium]